MSDITNPKIHVVARAVGRVKDTSLWQSLPLPWRRVLTTIIAVAGIVGASYPYIPAEVVPAWETKTEARAAHEAMTAHEAAAHAAIQAQIDALRVELPKSVAKEVIEALDGPRRGARRTRP